MSLYVVEAERRVPEDGLDIDEGKSPAYADARVRSDEIDHNLEAAGCPQGNI